jgi:hypothetical protein
VFELVNDEYEFSTSSIQLAVLFIERVNMLNTIFISLLSALYCLLSCLSNLQLKNCNIITVCAAPLLF